MKNKWLFYSVFGFVFAFSSSMLAVGGAVPDGGSTVLMLLAGCAALFGLAKGLKK